MRPYIEMNTQLRQQSTSNFERDHFKKMVNSVYGKTFESQKKRNDIMCTTIRQQNLKLASKPHCRNQRIFNEGLAVVDMERTTLLINRPFYVGFTVLELSKLHIYETHYNHFVPLYGRNCRLIYSDTDSLIYQIRTEDVNRDCYDFRGVVFDLSLIHI